MFAEVTCSGHSTILIPALLFILSCAPSLDHQVQSNSEWPLVLIRIYLASGYFSSGMCKLLCGARFNRWWGKGPTLQLYIYDGMWSRPAGPRVRAFQHALIKAPWVCTVLASGSVLLETGFILAPTSDMLCFIWGLNGLIFHLGIRVLQGLDFFTFWAPALLAFCVGVPQVPLISALAMQILNTYVAHLSCHRMSHGKRYCVAWRMRKDSFCQRSSTQRFKC